MKLYNSSAEIFVPDGMPVEKAIERTTHMAVAAHQDDMEIMAYDGILKCFGKNEEWFMGIVVTNGSGSPRNDLYADSTDEQIKSIRKLEQKKAAVIGEYGAAALLDYPSSYAKDPKNDEIINVLKELIIHARPSTVYTHNLADRHDTHIGVAVKTIQALRQVPANRRPEKVYGCEVWRGLDWMKEEDKIKFDVAAHPNLASALLGVFDSQICGGKRYDLATTGRRIANATYAESHGVDGTSALIYAMDLTSLMNEDTLDINAYVQEYIARFSMDVTNRINKMLR